MRVADEPEPPSVGVGELGEVVEVVGGEQAGFVDDQPGALWESPLVAGCSVGLGPFVEEFGDGVGSDAGAVGEHVGGLGGRRDGEHRSVVEAEVVDGGAQHGGLAGAGGSDDDHERVVAGDGSCGVGLLRVESVGVDGARRLRGRRVVVHRPGEDPFLLGEDVVARQVRGDRFDPHRSSIGGSFAGVDSGVEVDAVADHLLGCPLQERRPSFAVNASGGRSWSVSVRMTSIRCQVDDRCDSSVIDVAGRHLLYGFLLSSRGDDAPGERGRCDAEFCGFGEPAGAEVVDCGAGLVLARVGGGFALHRCPLERGRVHVARGRGSRRAWQRGRRRLARRVSRTHRATPAGRRRSRLGR